jgi:ribose transport system substrate-binding protein
VTVPRDGTSAAPESTPSPTSASTSTPNSSPAIDASADPVSSEAPPTALVPTTPPRSAEPSIGYISLDETQAFAQAVSSGVRASAAESGIDLVECDSGWTREGVQACADQLATAGVHGVISFQPFADLAAEVCSATGDAPTIGIVYDQGPCQVSQLQIDQAASGRLAGEAMGRFAAERWDCEVKGYISLESTEGDPIGAARMQGYLDGYETHCELPKQTRSLSGAQHLATAQTQMQVVLEKMRGKPILVAGVSEAAILGAMEAASAAGRANHLWYSGQLAEPAIRQHIACDAHYIASVAQFPERLGRSAVPMLVDAIEGREVPAGVDAELELVTAENVRELFPDTPDCDG